MHQPNRREQPASTSEHQRFPESSTNPRFGIWGTTKAGKTSFVTALYLDLTRYNRTEPPWMITPIGTDCSDWVNTNMQEMTLYGVFPPETKETYGGQKPEWREFQLLRPEVDRRPSRLFSFGLFDAPGAWYEADSFMNHSPYGKQVLQFLKSCDGLLMLLDPTLGNSMKDYKAITNTIEYLYQENNREPIPTPIIFALTKCDLIQYREATTSSEAAHQLLTRRFPKELEGFIYSRLADFSVMGTSAIGFRDGLPPHTFRRYDGRIGIRNPRENLQPVNVANALYKLASRAGLGV